MPAGRVLRGLDAGHRLEVVEYVVDEDPFEARVGSKKREHVRDPRLLVPRAPDIADVVLGVPLVDEQLPGRVLQKPPVRKRLAIRHPGAPLRVHVGAREVRKRPLRQTCKRRRGHRRTCQDNACLAVCGHHTISEDHDRNHGDATDDCDPDVAMGLHVQEATPLYAAPKGRWPSGVLADERPRRRCRGSGTRSEITSRSPASGAPTRRHPARRDRHATRAVGREAPPGRVPEPSQRPVSSIGDKAPITSYEPTVTNSAGE